jgi:hypothetical protein
MELSKTRDESVTPFVELDFSVLGWMSPADHETERLDIQILVGIKGSRENTVS